MTKKMAQLKFNELAPDFDVQTVTGEIIRLSSLWNGKTLILAFTRHFGCPQCKKMLSELVEYNPELINAGFSIAVITQGTPTETAKFCKKYAPGILCLADSNRQAYKAFGLPKGTLSQTLLSRRVWKANARVKKEKGWKPEMAPQGQDVMQMSGVFIIGSDGRIRLPYYYDDIADHPSMDLLLKGFLGTDWQKPFSSAISPKKETG